MVKTEKTLYCTITSDVWEALYFTVNGDNRETLYYTVNDYIWVALYFTVNGDNWEIHYCTVTSEKHCSAI